jgi:hypothetical protein
MAKKKAAKKKSPVRKTALTRDNLLASGDAETALEVVLHSLPLKVMKGETVFTVLGRMDDQTEKTEDEDVLAELNGAIDWLASVKSTYGKDFPILLFRFDVFGRDRAKIEAFRDELLKDPKWVERLTNKGK